MSLDDGRCDRCGKETRVHIMSYFNEDDLCMACSEKEQAHPDYGTAKATEAEAVRHGDMNYPGIGKPGDL